MPRPINYNLRARLKEIDAISDQAAAKLARRVRVIKHRYSRQQKKKEIQ